MKINIVDIDKFITVNNVEEVTNPIFFNQGNIPTDDGLFSDRIFGQVGTPQRANKFGYINLNGHFLHPVVYKAVLRVDRKISNIISGTSFYSLDKANHLVEDEKNGKTGLEFLYEIWDKINWKTTDSEQRKNRLKLLKLNKDVLFVTKFLVSPAANRDYNMSKSTAGKVTDSSPVNSEYSKLIRNCQSLDSVTMEFVSNITRTSIQNSLVTLYDYFIGDIKGKTGVLLKGVLGKTVDYATRSVITTPKIQSQSYKNMTIKFGYTGIPLSQLCVAAYPFYIRWITDFVEQHITYFENVHDGNGKEVKIQNVLQQFDDYHIKKLLDNYIKDIEDRFSSMRVADTKGNKYPIELFKKELGRNFTVTDLLFIASTQIYQDKRVLLTRYPIENINNIMPTKVKVLSTRNTIPSVKLEDEYLTDYPVVIPDYPADDDSVWIDSVQINNSYTGALGADFDGRKIS